MSKKVVDRLHMAQRVAARAIKPEKLQAMMLKLRKGAGTSLKFKDLVPVFDHLGGWLIEDTMILVAESRGYTATSVADVRTYTNAHPGNVQTTWDQAKSHEVSKLPNPEQMKPHERVYMEVSDIETEASGQTSFKYKVWQASYGTKMTAPNRASVTVEGNVDKFLDSYAASVFDFVSRERLSDWLQKKTPFLDQINEKLGTDPVELEKQKRIEKKREELKEISRTKENIGECPVCEGMFRLMSKTREGKDKSMPGMVLHGYKRPGTGTIHSNCPGEFWPPFELSSEGAVHYLNSIKPHLPNLIAFVVKLERGDTEVFYTNAGTTLTAYKKSEMDPKDWAKLYASRIEKAKNDVDDLKREIARFERKIAGWKPVPLNLTF